MVAHGPDRFRQSEVRELFRQGDDLRYKINDNSFESATSDEIWAAFDATELVAA